MNIRYGRTPHIPWSMIWVVKNKHKVRLARNYKLSRYRNFTYFLIVFYFLRLSTDSVSIETTRLAAICRNFQDRLATFDSLHCLLFRAWQVISAVRFSAKTQFLSGREFAKAVKLYKQVSLVYGLKLCDIYSQLYVKLILALLAEKIPAHV